jgi:hypothetical protein
MIYFESMKLLIDVAICDVESDYDDDNERESRRIELQYYTNLIHEGKLNENWWHIILWNIK